MKIVLLDAKTLGADLDFSPLERLGDFTRYQMTTYEELSSRLAECQIAVTNKNVFRSREMDILQHLKFISLCCTGYDHIDLEAAKSRGIGVANVQGYSTESVAQHTFAMLFYLWEHMPFYDHYVKSGQYAKNHTFTHLSRPWHQITGKRWGIIGLGAIGRKVGAIATAFGAEVVYYSTSGIERREAFESVSFDELLSSCDVISIHAPKNAKTENLIGYSQICQMKKSAFLLNLGRGGIIDEDGLKQALEEGRIAGAGLDVLKREPIASDNPLLSLSRPQRLLITPHNAWGSIESRQTLIREVAANIQAFIDGKRRNRLV